MKNLLRSKWFIIVIVSVAIIFVGRVNLVGSISDSAIVVGLGVDVTPDSFEISVQTFIAQGDVAGAASKSIYEVYSANSSTFSGALSAISEKLGLTIVLSHCHVIVASKDALGYGINEELQTLVDAWFLTLQSILVATEDDPEEILKASVPASNSSSTYLQSTLRQSDSFQNLTRLSIKSLFVDNYTKSTTSTIALVEKSELADDIISSSGGETPSSAKTFEFKMRRNLVFGDSVPEPFILEEESSAIVNAFKHAQRGGAFELPLLNGYVVHFEIISEKGKMTYSKNAVKAKLKMKLVLREYKQNEEVRSLYLLQQKDRDEIIMLAEETIKLLMSNAFFISQSHNADFFQIEDGMYRKFGRFWEKPENFLQNLEFTPEVDITLKRG
ncbi:MAG TPA: Ger(x)C family spore germination C-terminal domain-containing protein [Clostridia bacterium]|nr:Ger(x)C family spore germination C-terminal domain-containing protein [Clostridia bacterium]